MDSANTFKSMKPDLKETYPRLKKLMGIGKKKCPKCKKEKCDCKK